MTGNSANISVYKEDKLMCLVGACKPLFSPISFTFLPKNLKSDDPLSQVISEVIFTINNI